MRRRLCCYAMVLMTLGILGTGCPHLSLDLLIPRTEDLPSDVPTLRAMAEDLMAGPPTVDKVRHALAALEKAISLSRDNADLTWRAGKACVWLADAAKSNDEKLALADRGVSYTREGVKLRPEDIHNNYYLAMNLGILAEASLVGGLKVIPELIKILDRCLELDRRYDRGGALRVMGMVYAKAPPWPASVGDIDLAIELLTEAVELFPDEPLNRLFLGEALYEDKQYDQARKELRKVLSYPPQGEWAVVGRKWRKHASDILKKLELRQRKGKKSVFP